MKDAMAIKNEAKNIYSPYYIYCLVIVMIHFALIGLQWSLMGGGVVSLTMKRNLTSMEFFMVLSVAIGFFIVTPMEVGVKKFFLKLTRTEAEMKDIVAPFKDAYDRAVIIMFLRNIKIILWSALLIVPGIMKAYEYAMIPYIVAEEPDIKNQAAFERSKKLMKGNKMNLFKLQLKFLGLYIIAILPLGAGLMFLAPYTNTAYALFYEEVKKNVK